jgi:hypothetical protein
MQYHVKANYKSRTSHVTVDAGTEAGAIKTAIPLLRSFKRKFPEIKRIEKDVEFEVTEIPEPDPDEEIAALETQKAEIEGRISELKAKSVR